MTQPRYNPFIVLPALIAVLAAISSAPVSAQPLTILHSFSAHSGPPYYTNSDGVIAEAGLVRSGEELFGTTMWGGSSGYGTIFKVKTDGTGFTTVYNFTDFVFGTNVAGANNAPELVVSGDRLYGVATIDDFAQGGFLFSVKTDGSGFTNLHTFAYLPDNGAYPAAGLLLSSDTLYGTTPYGGAGGRGTVFRINTDGTGFTILHDFPATSGPNDTNAQGANISAALVQSGDSLFGTAEGGGNFGNGTLFSIKTDGSGFTNLHHFTATSEPFGMGTNLDGAIPVGKLTLSGGKLFGATTHGGTPGHGTLFSINVDGSGFSNLYNFANYDRPNGDLVFSNGKLYGTTYWGGGFGMVFAINANGTDFTDLYSFNPTFEGERPTSGLVFADNQLFGTTFYGGSTGYGTVFRLTLPSEAPRLTIQRFATELVIMWPAEAIGFKLQMATNLIEPIVWSDVLSTPLTTGGKKAIISSILPGSVFYRLRQ